MLSDQCPHRGWVKPLTFRRSLQEVPKGPEPPKDRRRKAAVWAAAKVGFSRLSVFVSPEPIAFRRWTFSCLEAGRDRGVESRLWTGPDASRPESIAVREQTNPWCIRCADEQAPVKKSISRFAGGLGKQNAAMAGGKIGIVAALSCALDADRIA